MKTKLILSLSSLHNRVPFQNSVWDQSNCNYMKKYKLATMTILDIVLINIAKESNLIQIAPNQKIKFKLIQVKIYTN